MTIKVLYKDHGITGKEVYKEEEFGSWDENGSYTVLYDSYSLDSAKLILPTKSVLRIEIVKSE